MPSSAAPSTSVEDQLAMPVHLLGGIGFVAEIDGDLLAFFQAKQRSGKLPVVGGDREDAIWGEFEGLGGDGEGVVGWVFALRRGSILVSQRRLTQEVRR